ncbi:MAG TPA: DUF4367 domain-containing protein [Bacilli bacterium]
MRRVSKWVAVLLCVSLALAGCGKKDAGTVVKELDRNVSKMTSYKGAGKMILHTGQQPLTYQLEVWYREPHFYRIALTNEAQDITQIVLRNEEGVFVLTPHLNKSFRFQSDWPEKQGQVYLYQTLAKSIVDDQERKFATDGGAYVFDVKANYMNSSFARQKIWLNKKNFAPKRVEVNDDEGKMLVEVVFSSFTFGAKFEQDDFDMDRNMTAWNLQYLPTFSSDGEKADSLAGDKTQGFGLFEPVYMPEGVKLKDMKDIKLGDQPAVLLRYEGDYNYTIMEARPEEQTVTAMTGDVVDLGYTIGILMGEDELKTLAWMHDGVEFRLSSGDLPVAEMIKVAQSVANQIGK